jgi:N utilization substance protein B
MVGPRRRSRVIALQVLHQMDVNPELDAKDALTLFFGELAPRGVGVPGMAGGGVDDSDADLDVPIGKADRPLVEELVMGVYTHREELDQILARLSRNWRVERMALVDRNVIRLALYELTHCPDVPVSVALNEAIELAKQFGSAEAGAFVNGLLDRAVGELALRR